MLELLRDPHRRHLALTLLVGAGLGAYLAGALETVAGFEECHMPSFLSKAERDRHPQHPATDDSPLF